MQAMHHVILLPGLASDATLWRDQLPALSARHRVSVTDVHARHPTLPTMAAALLAEQPGDLVLVGTSMGGMLALEVVAQAPQRVKALALLGTTARADTPEIIQLRSDAIKLFEQGRAEEVLRANVAFAFHPSRASDAELVATYLGLVLRAGAQQLIAQNRAVMARPDRRAMLPSIQCPTLVVCGDSDALTPPECSRELAAGIPGARLEVLAGCGHLLTLEQPQRVNALLMDWLAELHRP
jgi:pimeloyl-ACP methyl ester carboxylesterase